MLIKSKKEIKQLKESGKLMGEVLESVAAQCRPGISTLELDAEAERLIIKAGGRPAFKGYRTAVADFPFPATLCTSLNSEIVHGIPRKSVILKDGDLVSLDIGMEWPSNDKKARKQESKKARGVFTDTAVTLAIGKVGDKAIQLMAVTKQALEEGIKAAQPGNSVAAIGRAVENYVRLQGKYGIVRDLVGHGVGHAVHEEPYIPNYYDPALESIKLVPGMVIAIEPMISLGSWKVHTMPDGWTIKMSDNSTCAHFEHTVVITEKGNVVVTRRPSERE